MEFNSTFENGRVSFVDRDNSSSDYQNDSDEIKKEIMSEIIKKDYSRSIFYYGITDKEPEISEFENGDRATVHKANNCVFPNKYLNFMIYSGRKKEIHWYVIIKNNRQVETTNEERIH